VQKNCPPGSERGAGQPASLLREVQTGFFQQAPARCGLFIEDDNKWLGFDKNCGAAKNAASDSVGVIALHTISTKREDPLDTLDSQDLANRANALTDVLRGILSHRIPKRNIWVQPSKTRRRLKEASYEATDDE